MQRRYLLGVISLFVALAWLLAGCASLSCAAQARPFLDEAEALHGRWQAALAGAERADDVTLPEQIAALQAIKAQAEVLRVPSCAVVTRDALVAYMDFTLHSYEQVLNGAAEADVAGDRATAGEWLDVYEAGVRQLRQELALFPN